MPKDLSTADASRSPSADTARSHPLTTASSVRAISAPRSDKAVAAAAEVRNQVHPAEVAGDAQRRTAAWVPAVEQAMAAVGAKHALLSIRDADAPDQPFITGVGMHEDDLRRFRTPEFVRWMEPYYHRTATHGKLTTWSRLISDKHFECSPLYNEIVRPAGGFYAVAAYQESSSFSYFLALCRSRAAGDYTHNDVGQLRTQLACITAIMQLERRLIAAEKRCQHLAQVIDRLETGILLVDSDSMPLVTNRSAEALFAGKGLSLDSRGIAATEEWSTWALRRLVASGTPGFLEIDRGEERMPLRLFVTPYRSGVSARCDARSGGRAPAAIVMVNDPECQHHFATRRCLQALFGLTDSEAALATALLRGDTVQAFAERTGRSYNTAKTHLRSVFLKTGTCRQAELVRELVNACLLKY